MESYPSAEKQSVYSTAPADWSRDIFKAYQEIYKELDTTIDGHYVTSDRLYKEKHEPYISIDKQNILRDGHSKEVVDTRYLVTNATYQVIDIMYQEVDAKYRGALKVMVIMVRNEVGDLTSKPGRGCLRFLWC